MVEIYKDALQLLKAIISTVLDAKYTIVNVSIEENSDPLKDFPEIRIPYKYLWVDTIAYLKEKDVCLASVDHRWFIGVMWNDEPGSKLTEGSDKDPINANAWLLDYIDHKTKEARFFIRVEGDEQSNYGPVFRGQAAVFLDLIRAKELILELEQLLSRNTQTNEQDTIERKTIEESHILQVPSSWRWIDKSKGIYAFGEVTKQFKGSSRKAVFTALMNTFENTPDRISIQQLLQATELEADRLRIEINGINRRIRDIGLQFLGSGKGYYILTKLNP